MSRSPIALFVYKRVDHLHRTVEALKANNGARDSVLYIFADGAKGREDAKEVLEVVNYIKSIDGFLEIILRINDKNIGLANSIISGVSEVLNAYGRVIVVEDDLITAPSFLDYMNKSLDLYAQDQEVASVSGYVYPIDNANLESTFFLNCTECWGWGTWSRSWKNFNPNAYELLQKIKSGGVAKRFNFDNNFNFIRMLDRQAKGKIDSWAIRFYASTFLENKLTLYPKYSLVQNIGFDGSGEHCVKESGFDQSLTFHQIEVDRIKVEESETARAQFNLFFRKNFRLTPKVVIHKILKKVRKYKCLKIKL